NPNGPVMIAPPMHPTAFPPRDASLPEYDRKKPETTPNSLSNSSSTGSLIGSESTGIGMHQRQKSNPFVLSQQGVPAVIPQVTQQVLPQGINQQPFPIPQQVIITHTPQAPPQQILVQPGPQVTQIQTQTLIAPVRLEVPNTPQRLERSVSLDSSSN
ncbi:hypothetical protein HK096_001525, partial [Nowakowskiella sp. JEL0078]